MRRDHYIIKICKDSNGCLLYLVAKIGELDCMAMQRAGINVNKTRGKIGKLHQMTYWRSLIALEGY